MEKNKAVILTPQREDLLLLTSVFGLSLTYDYLKKFAFEESYLN